MILFDKRIRVVFEGNTTSLYFPTRKHEPYYKIWSNIPNKWWVTKKTGGTLQADGTWAEGKEPYSFDSPILAYRKARGWGLNDESVTDPVIHFKDYKGLNKHPKKPKRYDQLKVGDKLRIIGVPKRANFTPESKMVWEAIVNPNTIRKIKFIQGGYPGFNCRVRHGEQVKEYALFIMENEGSVWTAIHHKRDNK